jgi:hypothetical protein
LFSSADKFFLIFAIPLSQKTTVKAVHIKRRAAYTVGPSTAVVKNTC